MTRLQIQVDQAAPLYCSYPANTFSPDQEIPARPLLFPVALLTLLIDWRNKDVVLY